MNFKSLMICITVLTQLVIASAQSQWTLVWNEEFTSDQIDSDKWEVEEEKNCQGNHLEQLQCHTSKTKNVRVVDGVLAITAAKEKHLNKEYTSAKVNTKFNFTYGRIEIRASLPNGKLLRPAIWMLNERYPFDYPKKGAIDILSNTQNSKISSGIHFLSNNKHKYLGRDLEVLNTSGVSLSDFNTYQIEWNDKSIKWSFDGKQYFKVDTNIKLSDDYKQKGQPFDHNFDIYIGLGIGGNIWFQGVDLTDEDVHNWNCSVFMIDYIRIWKLSDNNNEGNMNLVGSANKPLRETDKSVNSICAKIMYEIDATPARKRALELLQPNVCSKLSSNKSLIINSILFCLICILTAKTQ